MPTDQLACLPRKDCRLWQEWHGFSHTVHGFDWVCHKRYRRYRCLTTQRIDGLSSFSGFYTCIYDGAQTFTPFSDTAWHSHIYNGDGAATAVDSSEWLLVEQNLQAHLCSLAVHDLGQTQGTGTACTDATWLVSSVATCSATFFSHLHVSLLKQQHLQRNKSQMVFLVLFYVLLALNHVNYSCCPYERPP